uniref:Glycosyltransferase 2-like domain-containing protein n=1 Tax=viral metagenome TaxID=1070528 RepID=A0A6C0ESG4_9ZZZZ
MNSCSIIIPTYNRKKFEKLIEYNILCQTYKNIIEVVIGDDGDELLELNIPYPIKYIKCERMTIGQKRNLLAARCIGTYIAHIDTDDVYFPSYIEHSISLLEKEKKNATGTSDMIFIFPDGHTGSMRNPWFSMANEATLVYKKTFWEEKKFGEVNSGEAIKFLEGRHWQMSHSNILEVMICICHSLNTVDKNVWRSDNQITLPPYDKHKEILKEINLINN